MIPPWLQNEAIRLLGQMHPESAKQLGAELERGAATPKEIAMAAARAAAKHPTVRAWADRIRDDIEALAQAERERREGKR